MCKGRGAVAGTDFRHAREETGCIDRKKPSNPISRVLRPQGRTKGTLAKYRRSLSKFFQWLPGEKLLSQETVEAYRGHMIEDLHYTPNSINMNLTPINAILAYMGLWNYQVSNGFFGEKPSTSRR